MAIRAIAFDVFGTLVRITQPRRPYRRLLRLLQEQGRPPQADDAARLMSRPLTLAQAAQALGAALPPAALAALQADLALELASISAFPDTALALPALRERGLRIALCSNLAAPYGPPALARLPLQPDVCAWSYAAGAIKPQAAIYTYLCERLDCAPEEVLMIGDTPKADVDGPRAFGMQACLLDRQGRATAGATHLTSLMEVGDWVY